VCHFSDFHFNKSVWLCRCLADRTNGRAIATLLRLSSVCLSVVVCL